MRCSHCGGLNPNDARFCGLCGREMEPPADPPSQISEVPVPAPSPAPAACVEVPAVSELLLMLLSAFLPVAGWGLLIFWAVCAPSQVKKNLAQALLLSKGVLYLLIFLFWFSFLSGILL